MARTWWQVQTLSKSAKPWKYRVLVAVKFLWFRPVLVSYLAEDISEPDELTWWPEFSGDGREVSNPIILDLLNKAITTAKNVGITNFSGVVTNKEV